MANVLTEVQINGISIDTHLLSYDIEKSRGYVISQADIKLSRLVENVVTLSTGLAVEIWRGYTTSTDLKIFSGYIESFSPEGATIKVVAKDKLWDLVRREATQIYDTTIDAFGGKISAIFTDLVTTYGGLNADGTTVQDSGTTSVIKKYVCNHADIYERCKELSKSLDWQFYYDSDTDYVYFEPLGFTSNPTILEIGANVISLPKWNYDITEMANDLTIVGAIQLLQTEETGQIGVTAGYTTTGITLLFEPYDVKVTGDAANPPTIVRKGGVPGSTVGNGVGSYYYSVDVSNKKILPRSTFTANWYFDIKYSYKTPVPVHIYNQTSKDTYGTFKKTFTFNDIKDMDDAQVRGRKVLEKFSTPFIYATLKVRPAAANHFEPGEMVSVVDTISTPQVNTTFVVNKVVYRYPCSYDEITVGDKEWRLADWQSDVMIQLKRIQEENFANQDIVVELVDVDTWQNNSVDVHPRYFKAETETVSGTNVFILSHPDFGILGTNQLGRGGIAAPVKASLFQYQNNYSETFWDTTFKDATTDATWSTASQWLAFLNPTKFGLSTSIDYNNGLITQAKLTATLEITSPSPITDFNFYLSANGGTDWEEVDNGVSNTFTYLPDDDPPVDHRGTDLRWKIVYNGPAIGILKTVAVTNYH